MLLRDPAPLSWLEPRLYKELAGMESMYIPNNPQYGLQLDYGTFSAGSTGNTLSPSPTTVPVGGGGGGVGGGGGGGGDVLCQSASAAAVPADLYGGGGLCDAGTVDLCDAASGAGGLCLSASGFCASSGVFCNGNSIGGGLSPGNGAGVPDSVQGHHSVGNGASLSGGVPYWTTDDMGTFSLPPLDLDPLPSLFPFSPCSANNYKSECLGATPGGKQPHDMADVLLSLKHAVVHPGQASGGGNAPLSPSFAATYPQQSQLSYAMHPHQMLMSPSAYSSGFCDQGGMFGTPTGACQGYQTAPPSAMFPSMSVNVSMNMTMHGYPPTYPEAIQHQVTCPQMQWSTSPQATSPVYQQGQPGILSPSYAGGATYSFTADFRAPGSSETPLISTSSSFKPVLNKNSFSPLSSLRARRPSLGYSSLSPVGGGKVHPGALSSEDESQRPNLCRICGKTYARPSTLKTHLRTHSGEKPYRCGDCNKSFSQAANLTAHVRTHSGEKPFRCPICDRRFSQSSSVTTHMRTHSGERPYRCRMCKKAFSDSSTLTKHLRIHSGEKPYQCKLCLLRFSQSGNLNRHMRVHGTNNQMLG